MIDLCLNVARKLIDTDVKSDGEGTCAIACYQMILSNYFERPHWCLVMGKIDCSLILDIYVSFHFDIYRSRHYFKAKGLH